MKGFRDFTAWPMPNSEALADLIIGTTDAIVRQHKNRKALITDQLSHLVLDATDPLIFHESSAPSGPLLWLNHDIGARQLNAMHR